MYKNYLILVNKQKPLSKNYVPTDLIEMDNKYCFESTRIYKLDKNVYDIFQEMIEDALQDQVVLKICSAYRSFEYQQELFDKYVKKDGLEVASTYSARPGYSEHQTGLAIDFIEESEDEIFDITESFMWLNNHAHEYGFIMRYPKGKENITGYKYEPWHYRYVGKEVAAIIKSRQITLEEYLEEK